MLSQKIYFAVLEEIYNNVGQQFYSLAIIQLHALSLLQKMAHIRDKFCLYMDPGNRKNDSGPHKNREQCLHDVITLGPFQSGQTVHFIE
jgi:hypothetical protein